MIYIGEEKLCLLRYKIDPQDIWGLTAYLTSVVLPCVDISSSSIIIICTNIFVFGIVLSICTLQTNDSIWKNDFCALFHFKLVEAVVNSKHI